MLRARALQIPGARESTRRVLAASILADQPSARGCVRLSRGLSPRPVVRAPGGASKRPRSRRTPADHESRETPVPTFSRGCSACECAAVPRAAARDRRGLGCARGLGQCQAKLNSHVLRRRPPSSRGHRLGTGLSSDRGISSAGYPVRLPVGAMDTRVAFAALTKGPLAVSSRRVCRNFAQINPPTRRKSSLRRCISRNDCTSRSTISLCNEKRDALARIAVGSAELIAQI